MKNYLRNWDLMRFVRLVLRIFIIIQGIQASEWLFIGLGAFFVLMPVLNIGCCGVGGCGPAGCAPSTRYSRADRHTSSVEEVSYEEVKSR